LRNTPHPKTVRGLSLQGDETSLDMIDQGPQNARRVVSRIPTLTLIGATTRSGLITATLPAHDSRSRRASTPPTNATLEGISRGVRHLLKVLIDRNRWKGNRHALPAAPAVANKSST